MASPLDMVRIKAVDAGYVEANCLNCGKFQEGDNGSDMGKCRMHGGEIQFRYGICLKWSTSNIVPLVRPTVIAEDGAKRLFGAEPPREKRTRKRRKRKGDVATE